MNEVKLEGRLTKDPKPLGGEESPGCRMRLAEVGAHPDHPLFIDTSIFGPEAEICLARLRKGSRVRVVGRLRFREWQRVDLSRCSEHWIAARRVEILPVPVPVPDPPAGSAPA